MKVKRFLMCAALSLLILLSGCGSSSQGSAPDTDYNSQTDDGEQYPDYMFDEDEDPYYWDDEEPQEEIQPYQFEIVKKTVNVYESPYGGRIFYQISNRRTVTIVEEQIVTDGSYDYVVWGRLASGGWIDMTSASKPDEDDCEPDETESNNQTSPYRPTVPYYPTNPPEASSENKPEEPKINLKQTVVHGVTFRYVSPYRFQADGAVATVDYDIKLNVKYCEPSEYMSDSDRIIGISRIGGICKKEEIGSLYKSAMSVGANDLVVFEIKLSGRYSDNFIGAKNIEFRKYTSGGTLLKDVASGLTDYELLLIDKNIGSAVEGNLNQTFYICFFTREVGRVDFKILGVGPNGLGAW